MGIGLAIKAYSRPIGPLLGRDLPVVKQALQLS